MAGGDASRTALVVKKHSHLEQPVVVMEWVNRLPFAAGLDYLLVLDLEALLAQQKVGLSGAGSQQLLDCGNGERAREQITLTELATNRAQAVELRGGLNAFGNYFHFQVVGEGHDQADDVGAARIAQHRGDEGAIQFESVGGDILQAG